MKTGKVSQSFRPEFVNELQIAAQSFNAKQLEASKHQWTLARLVNREWEQEYKGEVRKEVFYPTVSQAINAALPFPICSASGETLRRWCDVVASFADMPEVDTFSELLSFEHFRVARMLSRMEKNEKAGLTHYALIAIAYNESLTADELLERYGDKQHGTPSDYDRALGFLDSLRSLSFDWLPKVMSDEVKQLIGLLYEKLERQL